MPPHRSALAFALLAVGLVAWPVAADDPKSTDPKKADPNVTVKSTPVGDVVGEVVKVEKGSITLKIPEVVQTGVSRGRSGAASPRLGVKNTEVTYTLAEKVVVKTASGKETDLDAAKAGETVTLHVSQVKESKPGEKAMTHLEVKRIDVPNPTTEAKKK